MMLKKRTSFIERPQRGSPRSENDIEASNVMKKDLLSVFIPMMPVTMGMKIPVKIVTENSLMIKADTLLKNITVGTIIEINPSITVAYRAHFNSLISILLLFMKGLITSWTNVRPLA